MKRLDCFHDYWSRINNLSSEQKAVLMDFGMGMPDPRIFHTPKIILNQLTSSIISNDYNKYIPTEGNQDLLQEIVTLENCRLSENISKYNLENVMLVPGGIQAFSLLTEALLTTTDKIVVSNPSYFSLAALSEERYQVEVIEGEDLNFNSNQYKKKFSNAIRLAWFCNPNNPTGLYIPSEDLTEIINAASVFATYIVLDESCDNFVYDKIYKLPLNISMPNVIRIRTFSKDPNLSGYRLGYILGSRKIITQLKRLAPVIYGNPNVMALRAVYAEICIKNEKLRDLDYSETCNRNKQLLKQSRDFLYERLNRHCRVQTVILPEACYYMFAKFDFKSGSLEFTRMLLEQELLDVVPGTVFGMQNSECWIRMCFARDIKFLECALAKFDVVLKM